MGNVISATTRFGYGERVSDRFLSSARVLLGQSREYVEAGDWALALECAYQAALRTAGARIAASPVIARRRRLPGSAWDRLALVDKLGAARAAEFSAFSGLRSRVACGIVPNPESVTVQLLLARAEDFYSEVAGVQGWLSVA